MTTRSLYLLRTQLFSLFHKVRHDLAGEIVVAMCGVILAATFFYVFRDFIQEQVKELSEEMFQSFAQVTGHVILAATAGAMARSLRQARRPHAPSLAHTAHLLGEEKRTLFAFQVLWQSTIVVLIVAIGISAGAIIIGQDRMLEMVLLPGALYLVLGLGAGLWPQNTQQSDVGGDKGPLTRSPSLFTWRLKWWRSSRLAHLSLTLGLGAFGLTWMGASSGMPAFVPAACAFAAGLLWAIPLTFQLAADLEVAWVERSLGVSHAEFFHTYQRIGMLLGGVAAVLAALILLISGTDYTVWEIVSAAGAAATPALVEPAVMFQIDAKRPVITLMILVLVSVFIGTAIIAHPLSLLLLPIVNYYAATSQEGRFYRA